MTYPTAYRSAAARALGGSQYPAPRPGALPFGPPANDNRPSAVIIPFPASAVFRRTALRTVRWGIDITAGRALAWLHDKWLREEEEKREENPEPENGPQSGAFMPDGSNWDHCWTCADGDPITHQWAFNSGLGSCPPSTAGCLPGQALEGVMSPLGSAIPAHFGEYYWLSDNPINPLESPMKIVAGFKRAVEGENELVPLPVNAPGVVRPETPYTWDAPIGQFRYDQFPYEWPVAPWSPKLPIVQWPQAPQWGPLPGRLPAARPEPAPAPLPAVVGRTWVVRPIRNTERMEVVQVAPRLNPRPRRARRNDREKKLIARGLAGALVQLAYLASEADDIIDALVKALSDECVGGGNAKKGKAKKKAAKSPQAKLALIYDNFGCLDGAQGLWNILTNQIEDRVIGGMSQARNMGQRRAEGMGYIHTRPWLGAWRAPH